MLWSKAHKHRLLRACLPGSKRKLPPPACQTRLELPSVIWRLRGVQFPGSMYICNQSSVKRLSQLHFLCTQCLQPWQKMLLLPTPVRQTAHGNSPELCRRSSPVSIAPFQLKSLLTHFSIDSAMITRSSA